MMLGSATISRPADGIRVTGTIGSVPTFVGSLKLIVNHI